MMMTILVIHRTCRYEWLLLIGMWTVVRVRQCANKWYRCIFIETVWFHRFIIIIIISIIDGASGWEQKFGSARGTHTRRFPSVGGRIIDHGKWGSSSGWCWCGHGSHGWVHRTHVAWKMVMMIIRDTMSTIHHRHNGTTIMMAVCRFGLQSCLGHLLQFRDGQSVW